MLKKKPKIMIAMSGGVDSTISAFLLKKNNFYIEGAFMNNWKEQTNKAQCINKNNLINVTSICEHLKIKLNIFDFSNQYWKKVFIKFLDTYKKGFTPNPDILCNKYIKFYSLLFYSIKFLNFNFIATGHYANIKKHKKFFLLKKSFDTNKDQTYFLYTLNQIKLKYTIFPLANYSKKNIRSLAKKYNFVNHNKKDSMGICFIEEKKFTSFLKKYLYTQPGIIYNKEKKIIGWHKGIIFYTIGQRKGLYINIKKTYIKTSWYVEKKFINTNIITVVKDSNITLLYFYRALILNLYLFSNLIKYNQILCKAKIRHTGDEKDCIININYNNKICIAFFKYAQKSLAQGQSIVFYKNNLCIGGGIMYC